MGHLIRFILGKLNQNMWQKLLILIRNTLYSGERHGNCGHFEITQNYKTATNSTKKVIPQFRQRCLVLREVCRGFRAKQNIFLLLVAVVIWTESGTFIKKRMPSKTIK